MFLIRFIFLYPRLSSVCTGLVVFGVWFAWNSLFGDGKVHLLVPPGHAVELSANGQLLTPEPTHNRRKSFTLKHGDYTLTVKDMTSGTERTYALELGGYDDYVLPLDERQCFMRVDVSNWYGTVTQTGRPMPLVDARFSSEAPFSRNSAYLSEDELPQKVPKNRSVVKLLTEVPCDALKLGDRALLSAGGFY